MQGLNMSFEKRTLHRRTSNVANDIHKGALVWTVSNEDWNRVEVQSEEHEIMELSPCILSGQFRHAFVMLELTDIRKTRFTNHENKMSADQE